MATGMIYTVHADGSLARMRPGAPASEDRMQELVARFPELIADGDGASLLIRREQPVSDGPDSPRWSLDHLFVTRAAVPVLVELKRAGDTRLRREVVGQLLDYAANHVAYCQAGAIAATFAARCEADGLDADETLAEFLDDDDAQTFWAQVDSNLAAGRLKLVFVADVIPRELARVVEFLNDQMRADVRAVELKWFESDTGSTTLVPRIIGETERAASQKSGKASLLASDSALGDEREQFWTEFLAGLKLDDSEQPVPKPSRSGNCNFALPAPKKSSKISAYLNIIGKNQVGVYLGSKQNTVGDYARQAIADDWDVVKGELGGSVSLDKKDRRRPLVIDTRQFEPLSDPEVRKAAFAWLAERVNTFVNVLRPRVRSAVADYQSRGGQAQQT